MTLTFQKSQVRTIRDSDPNFTIRDGMVIYPRAMVHVMPECPVEYQHIIRECINNKWLKSVAHMTEREMLFIGLTK